MKPRTYRDKRELGWRNAILHTRAHVEEFYRTQTAARARVIAQEVIPGPDEALWECIGAFDSDHRLTSAFTFRKLHTMPAHYGQTSLGRSESNPAVVELVQAIGRELGYVGPADVDLKYDPRDGTYQYLELNPRLGMCNYFGTRCGVNVPLAAYLIAAGEPCLPGPPQIDGRTFVSLPEELAGRLQDGEPLGRILEDLVSVLRARPIGAYFAWDDLGPGPFAGIRLACRFLEKGMRGELGSVFTRDYGRIGRSEEERPPEASAASPRGLGAPADRTTNRAGTPRHPPVELPRAR